MRWILQGKYNTRLRRVWLSTDAVLSNVSIREELEIF